MSTGEKLRQQSAEDMFDPRGGTAADDEELQDAAFSPKAPLHTPGSCEDVPDGVSCDWECGPGLQLLDHLHIKKEKEELWESGEEKQLRGQQEAEIIAVIVKSEDEEEDTRCSQINWRQPEENIRGEPSTCSSAKALSIERNGDTSEGPKGAENADLTRATQQDSDGDIAQSSETEVSDDDDDDDDDDAGWREPLSESEGEDVNCTEWNPSPFIRSTDKRESMSSSKCSRKVNPKENTAPKSEKPSPCLTPERKTTHTLTSEKPFGCDTCGKRFSRKKLLKGHTMIHTGEKPFGCDICGKRFGSRTDLKRHTRVHTGEKPFGCEVCCKRFSSSTLRKNHMINHTGEKPFGCEVCGQRFATKAHLKEHLKIHTGEKPFQCDVCSKCFNSKTHLKRHMIVHSGEKPFSCDLCSKQFRQKTHLKNHMLIHTGEKPYNCHVCNKEFNGKTNLKLHMRIHTGEKPFGCEFCGQRFSQKASVIAHMRVHTGEKPFGCEVCGKKFRFSAHLSRHTRVHTVQNVEKLLG